MVYHKDLFPEQYFLTACSYHVMCVFQSESSLAKWSVRVFVYELCVYVVVGSSPVVVTYTF